LPKWALWWVLSFAFFSLAQAITPLGGCICRIAAVLLFGAKLGIAYLLSSRFPFTFLLIMFRALCIVILGTSVRWLKASVPVLCKGLFLVHPTGSSAAFYCLFLADSDSGNLFMKRNCLARSVGDAPLRSCGRFGNLVIHGAHEPRYLAHAYSGCNYWTGALCCWHDGAYRLLSAFMNVLALNDNQKILGTARKV